MKEFDAPDVRKLTKYFYFYCLTTNFTNEIFLYSLFLTLLLFYFIHFDILFRLFIVVY